MNPEPSHPLIREDWNPANPHEKRLLPTLGEERR